MTSYSGFESSQKKDSKGILYFIIIIISIYLFLMVCTCVGFLTHVHTAYTAAKLACFSTAATSCILHATSVM